MCKRVGDNISGNRSILNKIKKLSVGCVNQRRNLDAKYILTIHEPMLIKVSSLNRKH